MVGGSFEDVAMLFCLESGRLCAELVVGGLGRDRELRRGHRFACDKRVGIFGSAVVGVGAPDGCAECVAQCGGAGHNHGLEGRGYVRC